MRNILILLSSPRKNGNSDKLAKAFAEGAESAGNKNTTLTIRDMNINGCKGCEYCYNHNGECRQDDDMQTVYKYLEETDIIVFATPIYYQAFPSQLKAVVDRLYVTENKDYPVKCAVLLATYSTPGTQMSDLTITYYKALIAYHKWKDLGILVKDSLDEPNDIDNEAVLGEAFLLGKSIGEKL